MKKLALSVFWLVAAAAMARAEVDVRQEPTVQAVQKALPMVVNIGTDIVVRYRDPFESLWDEFYGQSPRMHERHLPSLGSGVVVDSRGYVVTNAHVVARATRIHLLLAEGEKPVEAKLLASDERNDLALVKIAPPRSLPQIELAREGDVLLGETVIAVGNPFGLGHTVTQGILSAKNRKLETEEGARFDDILQTDAAINPGNSGGALIDLNGKLIGITTAIKSPTGSNVGIGFAIPAWRVDGLLAKWLQPESRGLWFGANLRPATDGAVVANIEERSPAASAGLVSGDRIAKVDGTAVGSALELYRALLEKKEGDTVKLAVARGGNPKVVTVQFTKAPPPPKLDGNQLAWKKLGLKCSESEGGLVIGEVDAEGPAAKAEIPIGFILARCGGHTVRTLDELAAVLVKTESGDRLALTVGRIARRGFGVGPFLGDVAVRVR